MRDLEEKAMRAREKKAGLGLDIEAADTGLQCAQHFILAFADAGEHHSAGIAAGSEDALEFAHRDDVETGAEPCECLQHCQAGVRLDRVAHEVVAAGEGVEVFGRVDGQ